jgi:1,4-alpha-glucan branching enzyme
VTAARAPSATPNARELQTPFPSECIIRKTDFPWHETGYVTPQFHNFVIYQLHIGTFFTPNLPRKGGTFLDVVRKVPHFAGLGITAIQLMPIQEFQTQSASVTMGPIISLQKRILRWRTRISNLTSRV